MAISNLRDLFVDNLKDLYHAEKQLLKALPKMAKAADSDQLRSAFETHRDQTETHITRLEDVFKSLDLKPSAKVCKAMQGLIEEGKELLDEKIEPNTLDAGMIVAAQKIEHYEISGYGSMIEFAKILGEKEAAKILAETLAEEEKTDKLLTQIARKTINAEANSADD